MNFTELAKKRFSVRKFSNRKIDSNLLDEILQISLIAPTAKNQQPQRIYVLQSDEAFAKLDKLTRCRYGAATVLLFTYNEDEEWKNPLEQNVHSGVEDVSIVAAYVMLKAAELGLDTTWCNMFEKIGVYGVVLTAHVVLNGAKKTYTLKMWVIILKESHI